MPTATDITYTIDTSFQTFLHKIRKIPVSEVIVHLYHGIEQAHVFLNRKSILCRDYFSGFVRVWNSQLISFQLHQTIQEIQMPQVAIITSQGASCSWSLANNVRKIHLIEPWSWILSWDFCNISIYMYTWYGENTCKLLVCIYNSSRSAIHAVADNIIRMSSGKFL